MNITPETTAAVDAAITSRHSVRAFLPTPVPRETIEDILRVSARAPSGTNTQPWQVHVLTGATRQRLVDAVRAAYDDPQQRAAHQEEYAYYPVEWTSPYIDRRRENGWGLYALLGIARGEKLLVAEDIPLEVLQSKDDKVSVPPLVGALLKNEQDVSLFEKLVFMQRHNR
jgi:nitroreductase